MNFIQHWVKLNNNWIEHKTEILFLDNNEGIELYCLKQLSPCLGDNKYSALIRLIKNKPFLIDHLKYKSGEQNLNNYLAEKLGINSYMKNLTPLHLHIHEIDLSKQFKKQKVVFKIQAPIQNYFLETLDRLELKIDRNIDFNKEKQWKLSFIILILE